MNESADSLGGGQRLHPEDTFLAAEAPVVCCMVSYCCNINVQRRLKKKSSPLDSELYPHFKNIPRPYVSWTHRASVQFVISVNG